MDFPKNQIEFERQFNSEESCLEYLLKLRYPFGFVCKKCGGSKHWRQTRNRITCASCDLEISILSGTIFHKSHVPLSLWFRACWWSINQKQGVSALGLQRTLGLGSYRTAWMILQKLRTAMIRPHRDMLHGELEVDEIYIGGPEIEGEKYRSSKQLILVAVEKNGRGIGRIRMKCISGTSSQTLLTGIQEVIEPGSSIETDAWRGYLCLTEHGYKHSRREMAKNRKALREENALPRVHRVASLFKRWVLGTYHGRMEPKHLQHYLDEYVFRFNRRTSKSRGLLFQRLLENAVQIKAPTYRAITERKAHN
jgi:transposase-like protein